MTMVIFFFFGGGTGVRRRGGKCPAFTAKCQAACHVHLTDQYWFTSLAASTIIRPHRTHSVRMRPTAVWRSSVVCVCLLGDDSEPCKNG